MVVSLKVATFIFVTFFSCSLTTRHDSEKRILLNDQDFIDNQQLHKDIQLLKSTIELLQQRVASQDQVIASLQTQLVPFGSVYIQWGRKTCTKNGTELIYSGLGGGGFYSEPGRSALPVCVPHNPDLGPISSTPTFGTLHGMEYNNDAFGSGLLDKDVPCAVCLVNYASSVLMIPGKSSCYSGWNLEYKGMLASGHYGDAGASNYICVDQSPEVLEGGLRDDNGYNIFPVKAYCGSLKCPPYVPNSIFNCVVCSK